MSFRPTAAQAFGYGAYLGGLVGTAAGLFLIMGFVACGEATRIVVLGLATPVGAGGVIGGLGGLFLGRVAGVDVDDVGLYAIPRRAGGDAVWEHMADLRTERRGGRTRVTVYMESGRIIRLRAPYDGRLLAHDREFERKLFMLRNLWEMHRSFAREHRDTPPQGINPR